jgi:hypothetical protein
LLEQCLLFLGWPDSPSSLHHHWHFSIEQSPDRSNRGLLSVGYVDLNQLGFRNLEQRTQKTIEIHRFFMHHGLVLRMATHPAPPVAFDYLWQLGQ